MSRNVETIVLGSGDLYIAEFSGTIPSAETIEVAANLLGRIAGGATVEYKPTKYTAKDDTGKVHKTVITDEEVTLKSGLITWNGNTLKNLCATARVTESGNKRTVKIGGSANDDGKEYVIHFHHHDAQDGDVRLTIVGQNEAGFSLAFAKDKETTVDAEFKAAPQDNDGTLIQYVEDIPTTPTTSNTTTETTDTTETTETTEE